MKRSRVPAKSTKKPLGATSIGKEAAIEVAKKVAVWGTGITLAYFFVVRPIFQKVGIIKTQAEKDQEQQEQNYSSSANSPFNPNFYKTAPGTVQLVTKAIAQSIAKTLYDAHGFFNDDEQAVYGALRQLSYKTQLSWVADVFYQQYQQDLYQYLRNFLDDSEMSIVNSIAANLK